MRLTHLFFLLIFFVLMGCSSSKQNLKKITGQQIPITDSIIPKSEIEAFIKPFREHINKDLDSALAYAPKTYTKNDNELNTALGNLMAEIIFSEGGKIFNKRKNKSLDGVLLNHGGIRAIIPRGPITSRTAFQVMPFENKIVVAELKGKQINDIVSYLIKGRRAHPFYGLKIYLDQEYQLIESTINGDPIDINKTYFIATSDYLFNSGDNMTFFKESKGATNLDYKIRDAMIDYFKKTDTINPVRDDRFIRK